MTRNNFTFIKNEFGEWFIDLPEYISFGGNKSDLQMVAGADNFLDVMSIEKDRIDLYISDKEFKDAEKLHCIELGRTDGFELGTGAWYVLKEYGEFKIPHDHKMWLCDVTLFLFNGYFPEIVYFKKM